MSLSPELDSLEFQKVEVKEEDKKPFNLDEQDNMFNGMDVKPTPKPTEQPQVSNTAFWTIEFYQQFFNVDTSEVLTRILKTIVPWKPDFLSYIKPNPDLYGPFWISTTLLIILAISSNFGDFFNWYRAFKDLQSRIPSPNGSGISPFNPGDKTLDQWTNDFSKLTISAFVIYFYVFVLPIVLWVFMKWKNISISFIQLVSLYGYGMFPLIPFVILMTINYEIARWVFISLAALISILFITVNLIWELKDTLPGAEKLLLLGIIAYMVFIHLIFCLFLKIYFFTFWVSTQGYN